MCVLEMEGSRETKEVSCSEPACLSKFIILISPLVHVYKGIQTIYTMVIGEATKDQSRLVFTVSNGARSCSVMERFDQGTTFYEVMSLSTFDVIHTGGCLCELYEEVVDFLN